jgi:hypothetical protein
MRGGRFGNGSGNAARDYDKRQSLGEQVTKSRRSDVADGKLRHMRYKVQHCNAEIGGNSGGAR